MVRHFCEKEVQPRVADYDAAEALPRDLLSKMADTGFFGGTIPVELGGAGLSHVAFARVIEEISRTCNILGCLASMPSGLVGASIRRFGRPDQQDRWLRPLAQGEIFGAAGVTEPRSGTDVAGTETRYEKRGDEFILNGTKAWISNLDIASFFVVFATRDPRERHRGITAFIVPRETEGLSVAPYRDKLGFRPLCTGEVVLEDVRLTSADLLGEIDQGWAVAMRAVEFGRLGVASRAVGVAQSCLDDSVAYARVREAADGPIGKYQLVQSKITDMSVGVETARLLVTACAEAIDQGRPHRRIASMAKMYATDVAMRSATDAIQIHGAYGISREFRVQRFFRDAKVLQIVEGSNDVHRALIAEMELGFRADR